MSGKINLFLNNAKLISDRFSIVPLLYGSLGLEYLTGEDLQADDIDILIPKTFLLNGWDEVRSMLEYDGYVRVDEHEHTFEKDGVQFSYAQIEELEPFAGIPVSEIETVESEEAQFKLLSLPQYLKVYTASSHDGYRMNVKNKQDTEKIDLIRLLMEL